MYTCQVASAAIGDVTHDPKTWRLAAHSREDAEAWAAALEACVVVEEGE